MARDKLDALVLESDTELTGRLARVMHRVEERIERVQAEQRDFTPRELDLSAQDRSEASLIKDALEIRSARREQGEDIERQRLQIEQRQQEIAAVLGATPRPIETRALSDFAQAIASGVPIQVRVNPRVIEMRSTNGISSSNAGARTAVALNAIGRPEWLYSACSIPFALADSLVVQGPLYAALVAQTATAEGTGPKPVMTDPTLANSTLAAFGVTQKVSDQVLRFGVGPTAITERLASEVVYSANTAAADALETAAGTPIGYIGSASQMADTAIATVWAATGARPSALLVNPANYADLSDKAAVGPGSTVGEEILRFNGIALIVSGAITEDVAVAVAGGGFSAHGTDVLFASLPVLTDNTVLLRAETYFALLQHDKGAIAAVELAEGASGS